MPHIIHKEMAKTMSKKILVSLIMVAVLFGGAFYYTGERPMINDITTTLVEPPQFVKIASDHPERDYKYPIAFIDEQQILYPDLTPLPLETGIQEAFEKVKRVASLMKAWKIVLIDADNYRLEAVATTPLLRFKDDVVIEVRASIGGAEVHMRSKSRLGRSDFGANAKRIKEFFKKLESS